MRHFPSSIRSGCFGVQIVPNAKMSGFQKIAEIAQIVSVA
jgi:hypothetical protein